MRKSIQQGKIRLQEIVEELEGEIIEVGKEVRSVKQVTRLLGVKPEQVVKSLIFITEKTDFGYS
ncbi:hypothetical protein [Thermococcus sp.]